MQIFDVASVSNTGIKPQLNLVDGTPTPPEVKKQVQKQSRQKTKPENHENLAPKRSLPNPTIQVKTHARSPITINSKTKHKKTQNQGI